MSTNSTVKKKAFLDELTRNGGRVPAAAKKAGIDRTTPHIWAKRDAKFRAQMMEAIELSTDVLEQEAIRRAMGAKRKLFDEDGRPVTDRVGGSDTLLIFLLKGRKPEVYREKLAERTGVRDSRQVQFTLVVANLDRENSEQGT